jgi:hypothetical protein
MTVIKGFNKNRSSSSIQEEHLLKGKNNSELNILQEHQNHTKDVVLDTVNYPPLNTLSDYLKWRLLG